MQNTAKPPQRHYKCTQIHYKGTTMTLKVMEYYVTRYAFSAITKMHRSAKTHIHMMSHTEILHLCLLLRNEALTEFPSPRK